MKKQLICLCLMLWPGLAISSTKILLIGDSITKGVGSVNDLGFRDEIYWRLHEMGVPAKLVGSEGESPYRGCFRAGAHVPDFYVGDGGNGSMDAGVQMNAYRPHAVVIHLGTNDVTGLLPMGPYRYSGTTTFASGTVAGQMGHLLAYLARWATGENDYCLRRIYLSKIIPRPGYSSKIDDLIAQYEEIVADANNGKIPGLPPGLLELVDQKTPFYTVTMLTNDQIHPNDVGYAQMGGLYAEAMKSMPMHLRSEGATSFSGLMGETLMQGPQVKVSNLRGEAQASVIVEYSVLSGDAILPDPPRSLTDANGLAVLSVQLGAAASSEIQAKVSGLKDSVATFTLVAERGLEVAGVVESATGGFPIPNVEIYWRQGARRVCTTGGDGHFTYAGFMTGARVSLEARALRLAAGHASVQGYDAALTAQFALGMAQPSAVERQSADVDGDGRLSLRDAALIARFAVGMDDAGSEAGTWRFAPDSLVFAPLMSDATDAQWQGRVTGDIDGSWQGGAGKAVAAGRLRLAPLPDSPGAVQLIADEALLSVEGVIRVDAGTTLQPRLSGGMAAGQLLTHRLSPGCWRFVYYHATRQSGAIVFASARAAETDWNVESLSLDGRPAPDLTLSLAVALPQAWALGPNFPNPFNGETVISATLPQRCSMEIRIHDVRGRLVRRLLKNEAGPGLERVPWDGRDENGQVLPSGVYLAVMRAGSRLMTLKMQLLK